MKPVLAATAAALLLGMANMANAAGLCNCCGDSTVDSCTAACAPVKPAEGQCIAAVDYTADPGIGEGKNPLYDVPLRDMWLGNPDATQREAFRKLLEAARLGAESDRRAALKARARGQIDDAEAAVLAKRYDDAIVNYYLGMQAYRLSGHR